MAGPPRKPYKVVYEAVMEKKKELVIYNTYDVQPPKNHTFVPYGSPGISLRCKELSRRSHTPAYLVSESRASHTQSNQLGHHSNRVGYHYASSIVDQACEWYGNRHRIENNITVPVIENHLGQFPKAPSKAGKKRAGGFKSKNEAAERKADFSEVMPYIRDLFPLIPEEELIGVFNHAWEEGKGRVGTALIPMAQKVQLAVVAHIRHNHTKYDKLLRSKEWGDARGLVQPHCLDMVLKWRGEGPKDEEIVEFEEVFRETIELDDEDDNDRELETQVTDNAARMASLEAIEPQTLNAHKRVVHKSLEQTDAASSKKKATSPLVTNTQRHVQEGRATNGLTNGKTQRVAKARDTGHTANQLATSSQGPDRQPGGSNEHALPSQVVKHGAKRGHIYISSDPQEPEFFEAPKPIWNKRKAPSDPAEASLATTQDPEKRTRIDAPSDGIVDPQSASAVAASGNEPDKSGSDLEIVGYVQRTASTLTYYRKKGKSDVGPSPRRRYAPNSTQGASGSGPRRRGDPQNNLPHAVPAAYAPIAQPQVFYDGPMWQDQGPPMEQYVLGNNNANNMPGYYPVGPPMYERQPQGFHEQYQHYQRQPQMLPPPAPARSHRYAYDTTRPRPSGYFPDPYYRDPYHVTDEHFYE